MKGRIESTSRVKVGFTLIELLVVIAIVAALVAIGIPVIGGQLGNARQKVDLANMRTAYELASIEWMDNHPDGAVAYYFNGQTLQQSSEGLSGYGQSTEPASEFAGDLPVEVTGTPNTFGKPNFLVVYCDALGVGRLSWGAGAYAGRQVTTPEAHTSLDENKAEDLDLKLLDSLQDAARGMTYGELKALISKYGLKVESIGNPKHSAIQLAICNVDPATRLPDQSKTRIYVPELFDGAGYDVNASNLYVINSRDGYANGDVIWLELGANINNASDSAKATNAFTYVKSNGDKTNEPFRYDNRKP